MLRNCVPIFGQRKRFRFLSGTTTDLAAAYSIRRLFAGYAGACVRVREASGDTEADIGFTSEGLLDLTALASHCGSASGYVVTWYDQSGNGNDATQSTAANQPQIFSANAGTLLADNGRVHVWFDGADDFLDAGTSISTSTEFYVVTACEPEEFRGQHRVVGFRAAGPDLSGVASYVESNWGLGFNNSALHSFIGDVDQSIKYVRGNETLVAGKMQILELSRSGTTLQGWANGSSEGTETTEDPETEGTQQIYIGRDPFDGESPFFGGVQEVLIYNGDKASERSAISTNINEVWRNVSGRGNAVPDTGGVGGANPLWTAECSSKAQMESDFGCTWFSFPTSKVQFLTDGTYGDYLRMNFDPSPNAARINGQCNLLSNGKFSASDSEDLYLTYYARFSPSFGDERLNWGRKTNGQPSSGGKLPGFLSGNTNQASACRLGGYTAYQNGTSVPNGTSGFSMRYMFKSTNSTGRLVVYLYVPYQDYYLGLLSNSKTLAQASPSDFQPCGNNVVITESISSFGLGSWIKLVQRARMNTPGVQDGLLQVWMNDQLLLSKSNIMYRSAGAPNMGVTGIHFGSWYGGATTEGPQTATYIDYANFSVSKSYPS